MFFDIFNLIGLPLKIGRKTLPNGDSRDYQDAKWQVKRVAHNGAILQGVGLQITCK